MRVLIDADGCPVVSQTIAVAREYGVECILLCDTAHYFNRDGATTIVVSQGADSVDYALVNMVKPYDIIVTQDYGLAAMCLARKGHPIHQNGMVYTPYNMDGLLESRAMAQRIRRGGGRLKGPAKRTSEQDKQFVESLRRLIEDVSREEIHKGCDNREE